MRRLLRMYLYVHRLMVSWMLLAILLLAFIVKRQTKKSLTRRRLHRPHSSILKKERVMENNALKKEAVNNPAVEEVHIIARNDIPAIHSVTQDGVVHHVGE